MEHHCIVVEVWKIFFFFMRSYNAMVILKHRHLFRYRVASINSHISLWFYRCGTEISLINRCEGVQHILMDIRRLLSNRVPDLDTCTFSLYH